MRLTKRGKRRLFLLFTLAIVGGGTIGAVIALRGVYRTRVADDARTSGLAAYAAGDYERALPDLSYAVSYRKGDLEALLAFADARAHVEEVNFQHVKSAIGLYRAVLLLDHASVPALEGLLDLYPKIGYAVETVDAADKLLELDRTHIGALTAKALAAYHDRAFEDAIAIALQLHELEPGALKWPALALKARGADGAELDDLVEDCRAWADAWTGDGRYLLLLAQILFDHGHANDARVAMQRAAQREAESFEILEAMLALLDQLQLTDLAASVVRRATERFENEPWVYEAAVRRAWRRGDLKTAESELARAESAIGHEVPGLVRLRALIMIDRGRRAEARAALESLASQLASLPVEEREAQRIWIDALSMRAADQNVSAAEAISGYRRAASGAPEDAVLQNLLGSAYLAAGELDLAEMSLGRAIEADPYWIAPRVARADVLVQLGRPAAAFAAARAVVERPGDASVRAYLVLSRAWLALGRTGAGIKLVESTSGRRLTVLDVLGMLDAAHPDDPAVLPLLAEAYARYERHDELTALMQRVTTLDEVDGDLLVRLAEVSRRFQLGYASELLERAGGTDDAALAAAARAGMLVEDGRAAEAVELLDQACALAADADAMRLRTLGLRRHAMLALSDDAVALMDGWLTEGAEPVETATLVLSSDVAWESPALIDRAIDVLGRHISADSPRVKLYRATALARFRKGDDSASAEAIDLVRGVLVEIPDSRYGLELMSALVMTGDDPLPDTAIRHLEHAISLYPGGVSLYPRVISLLQQSGDFERAASYLDRLTRLSPEDRDLRAVEVRLLETQGDLATAATRLATLVDETSPEGEQLRLADLLARNGETEQAEAIYVSLASAPDVSVHALERTAEFFAGHGRYEEGLELLRAWSRTRADGSRAHAIVGAYAARNGDRPVATALLQDAHDAGPETADDWLRVAHLHLALGDGAGAQQAAESGLVLDADHRALRDVLVSIALGQGDGDRASVMSQLAAIDLEPPVAATLDLVARATQSEVTRGDLDAARDVLDSFPLFVPAWKAAITLHVRAGDPAGAIQLAREASVRLPSDADLPELAARLLLEANRPEEARDMLAIVRSRTQAKPLDAAVLGAEIELALERPEAAHRALEPFAATPLVRSDAFVRSWIEALLRTDRLDAAVDLARGQLTRHPPLATAWLHLAVSIDAETGYAMLELAESELSVNDFGRLRIASAWADLGRRYQDETALDRAAEMLARIDGAGPLEVPTRLVRATLAVAQRDEAVAQVEYRAILAAHGEHPVALNNLANSIRRAGGDCVEAVAVARRAVAALPGQAGVIDTLAQSLLCAGEVGQAESILRSALAVHERHVTLRLTFAEVLLLQDRVDEARTQVRFARALRDERRRADRSIDEQLERLEQMIADREAAAAARAEARAAASLEVP